MKTIIKEELLSQETLIKLVTYDPTTGIFTWKERPASMFVPGEYQDSRCKSWNTRFANKEAGNIYTPKGSKTSYVSIRITLNKKKRSYLAHRLVFLYLDGHFPFEQVDHIDGDGLNNRRINLRKVGQQENHRNMPMQKNNTSGCVGVYWDKYHKKWQVKISVNGKNIHRGYFLILEDAIQRRKQLEIDNNYHENHGRN